MRQRVIHTAMAAGVLGGSFVGAGAISLEASGPYVG
jgi:hypothetical protein